jgi:hypothetical protein
MATCAKPRFFGLPAWYEYLDLKEDKITHRCEVQLVKDPKTGDVSLTDNIPPIGLAVLDMLLILAGLVSVVFVIYGGVKYVISQGEPDQTRSAQHTIINALVGGVIAMLGAAIVTFIGNRLGG